MNREDAGAKLQPAEKKKPSFSVAKVRSIKFGGIGEDAYVYREIRKAFEIERKETCGFFLFCGSKKNAKLFKDHFMNIQFK